MASASDTGLGFMGWLSLLSDRLYRFLEVPNEATQRSLLEALQGYREAVSCGMAIPTALPQTTPNEATTHREWWEVQLREALTLFRVMPTSDRLQGMQEVMQGYLTWTRDRLGNASRTTTKAPTASPDAPGRATYREPLEAAVRAPGGAGDDAVTWGMSPSFARSY